MRTLRSGPTNRTLAIKIERFAGHHEAKEALVLSVVGVTATMLIESLILLILYCVAFTSLDTGKKKATKLLVASVGFWEHRVRCYQRHSA
jgi:hypothetical protein